MKQHLQILFATIFVLDVISAGSIQCRDEQGDTVDWFVAYKLPEIKHSTIRTVREGVGYVYITSKNVSRGWELSPYSCNDSRSIMGKTLQVLYTGKAQSFARILYNDEPPSGEKPDTLGHTKGVVLGDDAGGLWLIHSVPHFPPPVSDSYSYPSTGRRYGQSFLCISLPFNELDKVGLQLLYNEPIIYDVQIPSNIQSSLPKLNLASKGQHISRSPWFNSVQLSSVDGEAFMSYAKSMHFGKDLYADWVASDLQTDLAVETWSNGPGRMASECDKPFRVENVELLEVHQANFSTHQDHSKWAAALTDKNPWICVGDINRMIHQEQRGGGTVCLMNMGLWRAYRDTVRTLDVCPL